MFDRMGRQFGGADMPMTSYAGNNALSGMAAAQMGQGGMGQMPMGQAMNRFQGRFPQMQNMQPPAAPVQPPGLAAPTTMQNQNALGQFGQPSPLVFNAQGLPQQFQDFRQQMTDWRDARPDRPQWQRPETPAGGWTPEAIGQFRDQFKDQRMDYRNQVQDWRGQRPQFAGWR